MHLAVQESRNSTGVVTPDKTAMTVVQHGSSSPSFKKRKRNDTAFPGAENKTLSDNSETPRSMFILDASYTRSDVKPPDTSQSCAALNSVFTDGTAHLRPLIQPHRKRPRRSKPTLPTSTVTVEALTTRSPLAKSLHPAQTLHSCHVCHRRPATNAQLSSYADCEACGSRSCYVCLRRCEGDNCGSHDDEGGKKICSACCVEKGEDGLVLCIDCLGN